MGYVPEVTIPAVLLLAPNGLNVTLRPKKAEGNLWMLPPSTAHKFQPPPLLCYPLTGTATTCCRCGPHSLATLWPILRLLARHHRTPTAYATQEQHGLLHTHF